MIKLTSFGTYKQKIGAGVHPAPKITQKVYKIAVEYRQKGCMIPMSFEVMRIFEDAGFKLKELIIKEQHNCKATGYWKTNSVKYNFLLIAHEYLFVFRK